MKKWIAMSCMAGLFMMGCSAQSEKEKKLESEDQALLVRGIEALQSKDPVKAVQLFEKALSLNPDNSNAYILAGNIYLRAERYEDVIRVLAPGVTRVPNNGSIPFMLAIAFKSTGDYKQAYLAAKRAEEVFEAWQQTEELQQTRMVMAYLAQEIQRAENPNSNQRHTEAQALK